MFHVSYLGIWWHHEIWISKELRFNYVKNENSFGSEIKSVFPSFLITLIVAPPPLLWRVNFPKRGGGSDFFHRKGGFGKIEKGCFIKRGVPYHLFSYKLILSNLIFLWLSGGVCFAYLRHIYQYPLGFMLHG